MARSRLAGVPAHAEQRILLLRGERVMLDGDLAELYGVETRALIQAVKRNRECFPADFMFQLTPSGCGHFKMFRRDALSLTR